MFIPMFACVLLSITLALSLLTNYYGKASYKDLYNRFLSHLTKTLAEKDRIKELLIFIRSNYEPYPMNSFADFGTDKYQEAKANNETRREITRRITEWIGDEKELLAQQKELSSYLDLPKYSLNDFHAEPTNNAAEDAFISDATGEALGFEYDEDGIVVMKTAKGMN